MNEKIDKIELPYHKPEVIQALAKISKKELKIKDQAGILLPQIEV